MNTTKSMNNFGVYSFIPAEAVSALMENQYFRHHECAEEQIGVFPAQWNQMSLIMINIHN